MKENRKVPVEVYSRTVGYYRPVNQWNKGKQAEFHDRYMINPRNINVGTSLAPLNKSDACPEKESINV